MKPESKRCSICREIKPASLYSPNTRAKDGLVAACKPCTNIRQNGYARLRTANPTIPDDGQPMTGRQKAKLIDLGIAIAHVRSVPGVAKTLDDIAAYAGCSRERVRQIEEEALAKVAREISRRGWADEFRDALMVFFGRREDARGMVDADKSNTSP